MRAAPPRAAAAAPVPAAPFPAAPLVPPPAPQMAVPGARGGGFRSPAETPARGDLMDMSMSAGTIEQLHRLASSSSSLSAGAGGAVNLGGSGCLDPNLLDLNDLSLSHDTIEAIVCAGRERMTDGAWGTGDGR